MKVIGSKFSKSSTTFVFFFSNRKTEKAAPLPLIGWDIFDFFSATAERNSKKLDRKQVLNIFYQVCDFLANWNTVMIDWDIFDFFSATAEWNSMKLDRKQDQGPLLSLCFSAQFDN